MKKLLIITALFCIFNHSNADDRTTTEEMSLQIKTIDKSNNLFKAQTVRWWYSGKQNEKHSLKCETDRCAVWKINEKISSSIVIHANVSIEQDNDPYCWDLYGGKVIFEMPTYEVFIVMKYQNTVCS